MTELHATQIILKPLITEKSTWEAEHANRYAFLVHPKANKIMIRDAVKKLYDVRVKSVSTLNRKGEVKRNRFGYRTTQGMKKAVVQLHPDDRIELL